MKSIVTTMTQRGQVTIPAEVRRKFGLKPGDKVMLTIEEDNVSLKPVEFTLEDTFGSVKPISRPEDFDALIQAAKDERATRFLRRHQDS